MGADGMNIVALVQADLERDFFGAPGRAGEDLAGRPALAWTLSRLRAVEGLAGVVAVCPTRQRAVLADVAAEAGAALLGYDRPEGPAWRGMRAARAFGRYNWRGGLAGTTHFDELYDAPLIEAVAQRTGADSLLLVGGGAALLDVGWASDMVRHHRTQGSASPLCFTQAPPGLAGGLFTVRLLADLAAGQSYPGRVLAYLPNAPAGDPIVRPICRTVPQHVMATAGRFLADTPRGLWLCRQIVERAGVDVDGATACRIAAELPAEPWPRELTIELTTRRPVEDALRPTAEREDLDIAALPAALAGLEEAGDVSIMFAGAGDALLHADWPAAAAAARAVGAAVGLATYGVTLDAATRRRLLDADPDVLEVYVDAVSEQAYAAHKRGGSAAQAWANIEALIQECGQAGRTSPMIVPTLIKTRANLHEQEEFYDRCVNLTGSGRIVEAGPGMAVVRMAPPKRTACRRLRTRLTMLSDGSVVACEQDPAGMQPLGHGRVLDAWRGQRLADLRRLHAEGRWAEHARCGACEEFHRP